MKILGFNYSVERSLPDDTKFIGMADSDNFKIQLNSKAYPDARLIEVIIHETLHAISNELELKLTERMVQGLSATLYQVLSENGVNLAPLLEGVK